MASSSLLPTASGGLFHSVPNLSLSCHHSTAVFGWPSKRHQDALVVTHRSKAQAFRVLANPNVSPRKGSSNNEVIMVDPLEAKRLAAKQMAEIKAKEKFIRRRQIEAINGAWAMIGLTAGLVTEGQTGKSILSQLFGYWEDLISFFTR